MRRCSYCCRSKDESEFNLEHIWPDALGGDALPSPWKTWNVCARCNELSGRFVDGEFIKSWFISNERSTAAREYLDPSRPSENWLPLSYMGVLDHPDAQDDEVVELWLGPCGDHVVHIRPKQEPNWDVYAGGKPTRKRSDWGVAFIALTSREPFWIWTAINSFGRHFRRAERYALNFEMPAGSYGFLQLDEGDADRVRMKKIALSIDQRPEGDWVNVRTVVRPDFSARFLAKVALGIGREVLGENFLDTSYAQHLRAAVWERDFEKRQRIPVRGAGVLTVPDQAQNLKHLRWPGAWVFMLYTMPLGLVLAVLTPTVFRW